MNKMEHSGVSKFRSRTFVYFPSESFLKKTSKETERIVKQSWHGLSLVTNKSSHKKVTLFFQIWEFPSLKFYKGILIGKEESI